MALSYDGNAIIPAPLLTQGKTFSKTPNEETISVDVSIVLRGTLLPNKGSPLSDATFSSNPADENFVTDADKHQSILNKQFTLRRLFTDGGKELQWIPEGGGTAVKAYPFLESIDFEPGTWVDLCHYTVNLRSNKIFGPFGDNEDQDLDSIRIWNLKSASDQWSVEESPQGTTGNDGDRPLSVRRTISAVANVMGAEENIGSPDYTYLQPWQRASGWVLSQDSAGPTNMNLPDDFAIHSIFGNIGGIGYTTTERLRVEQIDKRGGSYTLTESFTLVPGTANYIEEYTVTQESSNEGNTTETGSHLGVTNTYRIAGTITGLATDTTDNIKYNNANTRFEAITPRTTIMNALGLTGDTGIAPVMSKVAIASTISRDQTRGIISYDFTYADQNYNLTDVTGNVSHYTLEVSQQGGSRTTNFIPTVLAVIPIPGRANGPIIQNMNTRPVVTRNVNCTLFYYTTEIPLTSALLETYRAAALQIITNHNASGDATGTWAGTYLTNFSESVDREGNSYTANATYTLLP